MVIVAALGAVYAAMVALCLVACWYDRRIDPHPRWWVYVVASLAWPVGVAHRLATGHD